MKIGSIEIDFLGKLQQKLGIAKVKVGLKKNHMRLVNVIKVN